METVFDKHIAITDSEIDQLHPGCPRQELAEICEAVGEPGNLTELVLLMSLRGDEKKKKQYLAAIKEPELREAVYINTLQLS